MNLGNTFMRAIALSPAHFLLGNSIGMIIVTSLRSRTWWRNLRVEQTASFTIGGKRMNVRGQVVEDATAVANALMDLFRANPRYARHS